MDTKWKRFSRSMPVRLFLNSLMIGCLLIEMILCLKIYDTGKQLNANNQCKCADDLYGNTALQEDFQTAWASLFQYILSSNCKGQENRQLLKKADSFRYHFTIKDEKGEKKTISNCTNNSNNLTEFPIYTLYKGYLNGNTYIKDWTNYYEDSYTNKYKENEVYDSNMEQNFAWLEINSLLNGLCQGDNEYAQYVAQNMVEKIQVYKEDLKNCLFYFYQNDSDNETITKDIITKLYGPETLKKDTEIAEDISNIANEFEVDEDDITYQADTGLYYNEYTDTYYELEYGTIMSYSSIDSDTYHNLVQKLKKQTEDKKTLHNKSLTKEEKNILTNIIAKAIYIGNNGLNDNAQIFIPISAILDTPEEYSISLGVDEAMYQKTHALYMKQYNTNKKIADNIEKELINYIMIFIGVMIFLGLDVLALLYVCGKKPGTEEIQFLTIDRWYTEFLVILFILVTTIGLLGISIFIDSFSFDYENIYQKGLIVPILVTAASVIVLVELLCSLTRKIKGGILIQQSILGKIIGIGQEKLYYGKTSKLIMVSYLIICLFWLLFEFIGFLGGALEFIILMHIILVVLLLAVGIRLHHFLQHWEQIRDGVRRVKAGEIKYQIPTDDSTKPLNLFAKDINSLSEGLENAVDEMLKSERLKTELISNVSHDIKTPLTSIITYVDLMKKEDVQPEKVKDYIEVLDQKSQRLKTLTNDLFEAAKATSGAIAVDTKKIDLGSLVNQAIGEFTEKLEMADLNIRNNVLPDTYFVMADGKLTWRIMENLLGNISKYALAGSRVYIDATDTGNTILLTLKNISNTELNISADELMERFTRGDQSRHSEGSGLGLNIAQSLATLQSGNFHVEVDGDLFKAILELPKQD